VEFSERLVSIGGVKGNSMKKIYMDYAATSPVKTEVFEAMKPYFSEKFGNPSSIHSFGQETRHAINDSRENIAKFLNCEPFEIFFTSGGTESDNLSLRGSILKIRKLINPKIKPHIITSAFEHHAITHTCEDLEKMGLAQVTYIKPDKEGIVRVKNVEKAIKSNTVLVSIMYVNNEIGTVQPISEIGKMIKKINLERLKKKSIQISFHTDAVQAIEYFDCDVKKLGVDMLSLSAHKFGGPKGIGALYVKKGTLIESIQTGGAQEYNLRAGTENVAGIVGMGEAIRLISAKRQAPSNKSKSKSGFDKNMLHVTCYKLQDSRDYFINQILDKIPDAKLNGSKKFRSPNNINISFNNAEGESILLNLDLLGISASSGSACTSGSLEPSHVLRAIGLKDEEAHGAIRFTLGEKNTKEEINFVVANLIKIVNKLRKMSPYK
jgi:cysteine desulfurase